MDTANRQTNLESLRARHQRLIYRNYSVRRHANRLEIAYDFLLEPDICFTPRISLPCADSAAPEDFADLVFHAGLVELISYWKAACPPVVRIDCGVLNENQQRWWHDLFMNGLGEFFYRNAIDFTAPGFLSFDVPAGDRSSAARRFGTADQDLILVGGGKDSALTMELLQSIAVPKTVMMLNPVNAAWQSAQAAGYGQVLTIERKLDPRLFELNRQGYLNGHTPFSACLAFIGIIAAAANGFAKVIVSNEVSANEGTIFYLDREVNHQYSKSFRFEQMLRDYSARWLVQDVSYFSFLRPLIDLQIARLLTDYPRQLGVIRSCNRHHKEGTWCGHCPKCAFVYLCLFPFAGYEAMVRIFGEDILNHEDVIEHIRELAGVREAKPFECVGTREESQAALSLTVMRYRNEGRAVPEALTGILMTLEERGSKIDPTAVLRQWNNEHALPAQYETILHNALAHASLA